MEKCIKSSYKIYFLIILSSLLVSDKIYNNCSICLLPINDNYLIYGSYRAEFRDLYGVGNNGIAWDGFVMIIPAWNIHARLRHRKRRQPSPIRKGPEPHPSSLHNGHGYLDSGQRQPGRGCRRVQEAQPMGVHGVHRPAAPAQYHWFPGQSHRCFLIISPVESFVGGALIKSCASFDSRVIYAPA